MAFPDIISAILSRPGGKGSLPRSVLLVHLLAFSQETTASPQTSQVRHTELPLLCNFSRVFYFEAAVPAAAGLDLQVAPTAEAQSLQGGQAFTPRIARLVTWPEMWHHYVSDTSPALREHGWTFPNWIAALSAAPTPSTN